MGKIQLDNIEFSYSGHFKPVFQDVNLILDTDWKLGLIGRNGRGKTTLLNLLHGAIKVDKGHIYKEAETEMFPYDYSKTYTNTLDLIKDNIGPYFDIETKMEEMLAIGTEDAYMKYADLIAVYNDLDGYELEANINKELNLMQMPHDILERDFNTLSGGEKTKALIIALFLRKNYFLLLDEPTNHLDSEGRDILAKYLSRKKGFIVVSHDQSFLDETIDHVLSINKGNIQVEKGTFSSWNTNRLMIESYELRKKERIENEVRDLEKSAKQSRMFSHNKESEKKGAGDKGFVGARAARLMKRAKNIERRRSEQLEEKKSLLKNYEHIPRLIVKQDEPKTKALIRINNLSYTVGDRSLISNMNLIINRGDRVWIKGKNGSGKSTLLNIIGGRVNDYLGYVKIQNEIIIAESYQNAVCTQGYLNDHLAPLNIDMAVFRNILSYFNMYEEYFERPLETFSQGELKKIDIAKALSIQNHLIILDEPLNYMDMFFRIQLEKAILHYELTVVFVEHDIAFGEALATKIIEL